MRKVDYIIVGLGIAGLSLCERLRAQGNSFVVIDHPWASATRVAGGIINPVVIKRLNAVWRAAEFLKEAVPFYNSLQAFLKVPIITPTPIDRIFSSIAEQNNWLLKSTDTSLEGFITSEILKGTNPAIISNHHLGRVLQGYQIDVRQLLDAYRNFLKQNNLLIEAKVNYSEFSFSSHGVEYDTILAEKVVFAEGSKATQNPWINKQWLIPKKGEYLVIEARELQLQQVIKGPYFIIPLGEHRYKVGATFAHGDFNPDLSQGGEEQLIKALKKMLRVNFEVIEDAVGFRPTVGDRRPLLGRLHRPEAFIFNGLGTRGLLMAPLAAQWLIDYIEMEQSLPPEVDIRRFKR